jgi:iron complex outermembrane recepter protein
VGARGTDQAGRLFFDVALFRLDVRDQLTPFEGADGRTYYRNAEATRHSGLEALVEWQATPSLRLGATYAWSVFAFTAASGDDGAQLEGNRLPGVPEHRLAARARLALPHLFASASVLAAGPTWADDLNTARADGFTVVDLRVGHPGIPAGGAALMPFIEVQNALNARYAGSVALNAQAGRFFEPGAGRSLQIGLSGRLFP